MKPYSKDLRTKVLAAVDRGMPRTEVVWVFGVSAPTIRRYLRLRRETGDVEPRPVPGPPARKGRMLQEALPEQVSRNPDLTLEQEHRELFYNEHGVAVSTASVSRALKKSVGLPLQKSPSRPPNATRRSAKAGAGGGREARDPRLLVFVEECGRHTSMSRLFGPGAQGREGLRPRAAQP